MQNISQIIFLIVLLVLIATSYMTQAATIQDVNDNSILQHTIEKRQGNCLNLVCRRRTTTCNRCPGTKCLSINLGPGIDDIGFCV
jgi:hypothetical protein